MRKTLKTLGVAVATFLILNTFFTNCEEPALQHRIPEGPVAVETEKARPFFAAHATGDGLCENQHNYFCTRKVFSARVTDSATPPEVECVDIPGADAPLCVDVQSFTYDTSAPQARGEDPARYEYEDYDCYNKKVFIDGLHPFRGDGPALADALSAARDACLKVQAEL